MTRAFPKIAKSYLKFISNRSVQAHTLKHTVWGFDFTGNKFMQDDTFELEETRLLGKLLEDSDVFVDVGANI